jgi:UDP-glucose 4-epimerase
MAARRAISFMSPMWWRICWRRWALEREPGALVLNVCTGRETSIALLAGVLGQLCDAPPRITLGPPRAGDIRRSMGDPERAKAVLGVEAATGLESGLRSLLTAAP